MKILFPIRNYNRVIDVIAIKALPDPIKDLISKIENIFNDLQSDECDNIIQELEKYKGFIDDVEIKKQEINDRLISVVSEVHVISEIKKTLYDEIEREIIRHDTIKFNN